MRQCPKRGNLLRKDPTKKSALTVASPPPSPGPPGTAAKPIDETKAATKVDAEVLPPGTKPKKKLLGFLSRETEAIRTDVSKPRQEFDWILPEEANARLWQAGLSFIRQSLNLFNRFLGMPPIPDEIMKFGKADLDSINEAFRAPTSKLLYTMGFRTVESAVRFTLVFSGFSLFGLMVIQLGMWYWQELPKAPKFVAWREKQKEKAVRFRDRQLQVAEERRLAAQQRQATGAAPG